MPRNKTAKRTAKRAITKNTTAIAQRMEQDFAGVPAKLIAQLNKEITSLKQKENKLKTAHNKTKADVKNWEVRIKVASKANKTATVKKQLIAAKKAYTQANKTQTGLNKELQQASLSLETLLNKQAKLTALSKLLNQFEKDWTRNLKKAKVKVKKSGKKAKTTSKTHSIPATIPAEQSHFEPVETIAPSSENSFSEAAEMAS